MLSFDNPASREQNKRYEQFTAMQPTLIDKKNTIKLKSVVVKGGRGGQTFVHTQTSGYLFSQPEICGYPCSNKFCR